MHVLLATMPFRRHRVPRWVSVKVLNPYYNPLSAAVRVARTTAGTHFSENSQKKRNSTCYCGSLVVHLFFLAAGSPVLLWDSGFRSAYYAELSFLRGNTTQQSRQQILSLSVCQVCVLLSRKQHIASVINKHQALWKLYQNTSKYYCKCVMLWCEYFSNIDCSLGLLGCCSVHMFVIMYSWFSAAATRYLKCKLFDLVAVLQCCNWVMPLLS